MYYETDTSRRYAESDKALVRADLDAGRADVVNRHSTCAVELTWIPPHLDGDDEVDGAWSLDTGWVRPIREQSCIDCGSDLHGTDHPACPMQWEDNE